jgi:hypothetical protein
MCRNTGRGQLLISKIPKLGTRLVRHFLSIAPLLRILSTLPDPITKLLVYSHDSQCKRELPAFSASLILDATFWWVVFFCGTRYSLFSSRSNVLKLGFDNNIVQTRTRAAVSGRRLPFLYGLEWRFVRSTSWWNVRWTLLTRRRGCGWADTVSASPWETEHRDPLIPPFLAGLSTFD